jgi:hypothetical protein
MFWGEQTASHTCLVWGAAFALEQKSDAEWGSIAHFHLLIGGRLGIERQNWTMSDLLL